MMMMTLCDAQLRINLMMFSLFSCKVLFFRWLEKETEREYFAFNLDKLLMRILGSMMMMMWLFHEWMNEWNMNLYYCPVCRCRSTIFFFDDDEIPSRQNKNIIDRQRKRGLIWPWLNFSNHFIRIIISKTCLFVWFFFAGA